ncbi:MAG: hypothetical protein UY07_C0015G0001 [Parcubacteria group bacterium GW2011_GWA1_47_8]|nr:MAG: hypothetical protein UY07_C0015G0001 [Parcubacteria group bacterium GW2011_GWA1_47_8]
MGSSARVTLLVRGIPFKDGRTFILFPCGKNRPIQWSAHHKGVRYTYNFELIHDQLPLAVPCYDLALVTKLTLGPHKVGLRALSAPLA